MKHWATELKINHQNLKQAMRLRALADYIVFTFSETEQEEILKHLQDSTKKITIQFAVTDLEAK